MAVIQRLPECQTPTEASPYRPINSFSGWLQVLGQTHTTLAAVSNTATLGGLRSTDGSTVLRAILCESVMESSELIHIITMGELAIRRPNPLKQYKLQCIASQSILTLPSSRNAPFPTLVECLQYSELGGNSTEMESVHRVVAPLFTASTHINWSCCINTVLSLPVHTAHL